MTDTANETPELVVNSDPVPEVAPSLNELEALDIPEFLRRQAAEDQKVADALEHQEHAVAYSSS